MSFVVAAPEQVQTAAQGLAGIHSTLAEASASVAAPTTGMAAAAEDQVSAGVAAMFNSFGQEYQVLSAETQAFHAQFVNLMNAGAAAYLSTDVANAQQNLLNAANAPVEGLLGQSSGAATGARLTTKKRDSSWAGVAPIRLMYDFVIVDRPPWTSQGEWAMSFVIAAPDLVQGAAQDLAGIRASLAEAAATVAAPTTGVVPAAADEVSAAISALFGNFGQEFQLLSAQAQAFHAQFVGLMNAGAGAYLSTEVANAQQVVANAFGGGGSAAAVAAAATPGAGGLLGGLLGGGSGSGGLVGGLIGGTSGGGGLLGGLTGGTSGVGGLVGGLTGTSGLGVLGAQDVAATAGYHSGASAAAGQLAPWQQALSNQASNLAKILGLSPVTHPVAGDPDFGSQVTSFGPATQTALADPDDNFFDALIFSSPQFTDTLTSGFEPTLGLGAPGHTINTVQSPVLPFLNSSISIPVTDPIAPLFAALLPLGF